MVWDIPVKRRTVGDIVCEEEKWVKMDNEMTTFGTSNKRPRNGKHEELEKALFLWFGEVRAKNLPLTEDIIKTKAKRFGDALGITDFQ